MKKTLFLKHFQDIVQYRQDTAKTCPGDSKWQVKRNGCESISRGHFE